MPVLLIGTLDTKGPEIAYLRDRIRSHGVDVLVADSGILGEPLDIVPDITRRELAEMAGTTIDAIATAAMVATNNLRACMGSSIPADERVASF